MRPDVRHRLIVVAGPTASGKSELALTLARRLGGEIVSADSRQIYRGLDAGTCKPPRDAAVPVHMVDVADAHERYDAGRFASEASGVVSDILKRDRPAFIVGGTGLYIRALLDGLSPLPARSDEIRTRLMAQAAACGRESLHARLAAADPASARRIPAGNVQRVVRALEVLELSGRPLSALLQEPRRPALPPAARFVLRLEWPAAALRERIARRARGFWPALLAEARALLRRGLTGAEPGLESLGYPQALACARGELSEDEGLARLIAATCAYAKRQRTWFRHQLLADAVLPGGPDAERLATALTIPGSRP